MHELAVTENIIKIAVEHAEKANAKKVSDIHVVLGQLSSIVDDSVQFYWDFISKDTICENAKLHFKRIPAKLLCLDCNNEFLLNDELQPCPVCSSTRIKVLEGEEFWLDSIEIEK